MPSYLRLEIWVLMLVTAAYMVRATQDLRVVSLMKYWERYGKAVGFLFINLFAVMLVIKMLSVYQDTWMDVNSYAQFDIRNRDKQLLGHIQTCSDQIFQQIQNTDSSESGALTVLDDSSYFYFTLSAAFFIVASFTISINYFLLIREQGYHMERLESSQTQYQPI